MASLNNEVRHRIKVVDSSGDAVTGLVTGSFTLTLQYNASGTPTTASETVTVTEIGLGYYWLTYTPTEFVALYMLTVEHATYYLSDGYFEDYVESGVAGVTGPYLTTRANVKTALGIATAETSKDSAIDLLLASVTKLVQGHCDRTFFSATYTEYPRILGSCAYTLNLAEYPVSSVTTVHVSTDAPRVYATDELLTADEDYMVDLSAGVLHRTDGSEWPAWSDEGPNTVKVVYVAGYDTIPADLERAAIEIIAVKLYKGTGRAYHVTSVTSQDGTASGFRFDDLSDDARRTLDRYRRVA